MSGWELISVEQLTLHRVNRLANMYTLSPFVWRDGEHYRLLLRAVPRRDDEPRLKMAEIWHGVSRDGLHFVMDIAPTLFPGLDLVDLDGCEDPTVHIDGEVMRVWYTGYNEQQKTGRLLFARGPDVTRLAKAGLAIDSSPGWANPKEATVAAMGAGRWRLFLEHSRNEASLIAQAESDSLDGPWSEPEDSPLAPRADRWDNWHMSTGPIVGEGTAHPTMFYNGASHGADWRIGHATFDRRLTKVLDRCDEPLITPSGLRGGSETDIAFAASAVEEDGQVMLYFSQSDQDLRRAVLRRR